MTTMYQRLLPPSPRLWRDKYVVCHAGRSGGRFGGGVRQIRRFWSKDFESGEFIFSHSGRNGQPTPIKGVVGGGPPPKTPANSTFCQIFGPFILCYSVTSPWARGWYN